MEEEEAEKAASKEDDGGQQEEAKGKGWQQDAASERRWQQLKTESMMERPMLGQFLDVLINSDRIVIYDGEDSKSPELYRGYVACFNYDSGGIDTSRRIAKTGLGCEIFRVEKRDLSPFVHTKTLGAEVPVENISDFRYSDLEEIIYTRIFLEVQQG